MFYNDIKNSFVVKNQGLMIKDMINKIQLNQNKLLVNCRLPIRKSSSKSLPPQSFKFDFPQSLLSNHSKLDLKGKLCRLLGDSATDNAASFINQPQESIERFYETQSEAIATQNNNHGEFLTENPLLPGSIYRLKGCVKKLRKSGKYKKAMMKTITERDSNRLLKDLFLECHNLQQSLTNINRKRESFKVISSQSVSSKFTTITSNDAPEPLPRQHFLFQECEDTLFGFEDNLDTQSKSMIDEKKTSISSVSFYVTAGTSIKFENDHSFEEKSNLMNENPDKKIFVSVYEKQFQRVQLLYPAVRKLDVGATITETDFKDDLKSNSVGLEEKQTEVVKLKLMAAQRNNNNNYEDDDKSVDTHQYFRQAQQLLSSNSSQMQYLIYGCDKNDRSKKSNRVEIQPFKNGERHEPAEDFKTLKSKLQNNLQSGEKSAIKSPKLPFQEIMDGHLSKPDINVIMDSNDDNKKKPMGPALQSFNDRRQRLKIESQANDHNLMLSRARMIKSDHLISEFDEMSEVRNDHSNSSDDYNASKVNDEMNHHEKLDRRNSKDSSSMCTSCSSEESMRYYGNHNCRNEKIRKTSRDNSPEKVKNNVYNSAQYNQQEQKKNSKPADFCTPTNNLLTPQQPRLHDQMECKSTKNLQENKTVKFKNVELNKNQRNEVETNRNENGSLKQVDDKYSIMDKLTCMEQQIANLTMTLNNFMFRINNIELYFQDFTDSFVTFYQEILSTRQHYPTNNYPMNYSSEYEHMNNSLNNRMSGMNYWNNELN